MGKVEEIIKIIKEKFKVPEEKIREEIKQKLFEFSGLISEEGAAILVARDYGLDIRNIKTFTPLSELVSGMRNVNVRVKVFKTFPLKEFERKDGEKGFLKVLLVADNTDYARLVFWNEYAQEAEEMKIKEGDILKIYNARTRENIFGEIDIIADKNTTIEFDEKDDLPPIDSLMELFSKEKYRRLEGPLNSLGYYETIGIITRVFGKNFFFKVCPICSNRVRKKEEKFICDIHGEIEPKNSLYLRLEINTFSHNFLAVAFRDVAEKIIESKVDVLEKLDNVKDYLNQMLVGKLLLIKGRARKNKFLNAIELVINEVENVELNEEIDRLIEKIKT
ncbi:MAG: DUF2240 family protein [Candidatus Aenigmatarchaeota archaeon]